MQAAAVRVVKALTVVWVVLVVAVTVALQTHRLQVRQAVQIRAVVAVQVLA
jgi:hypothetical protein